LSSDPLLRLRRPHATWQLLNESCRALIIRHDAREFLGIAEHCAGIVAIAT
jgi:hypothetical protein